MQIKSAVLSGISAFVGASFPALAQNDKMNVLFIMADDLRPELGCYGVEEIITPNIDSLASTGTVFGNAYCNVPVSGASRASLLTGKYPCFPNRFVDFSARASVDCPEAVPLSRWFTSHGYYTVSDGKVFHHIDDHADSWSEPPFRSHPDGYDVYWAEYNKWELWMNEYSGRSINPKSGRGPFCEWAEVPDEAYEDGMLAEKAVSDLRRLKDMDKPFFLACGFWKPHLPFNAPRKYWDLYDRDKIPVAPNMFRPENLPGQVQSSAEIFSYAKTTDPGDINFLKEIKHGYYACVSYLDAQVGKVLGALEELGLADNTIVVLFGDHGWHLGEHGFIGKHNLMGNATHVPLIVRVPGKKTGMTMSMVELVDLYPTMCELCGLPVPKGQLDGVSFAPVLDDLEAETKQNVYIQWQGGDNVVDRRFSYTEWLWNGAVTSRMLFDHEYDDMENRNVSGDDRYEKVMDGFSKFIAKIKKKL